MSRQRRLESKDEAKLVPNVEGRQCGECTACCTAIGVRELGKPAYVSCEHVESCGCKIYATRPGSCQQYECSWLYGFSFLEDKHRPDKAGFIVCNEQDQHGIWITFHLLKDMKEVDHQEILSLAYGMIAAAVPKPRGARVYLQDSLIPTSYPLDATVYPDEGEGQGEGLTFLTVDHKLYWPFAYRRRSTVPLPKRTPLPTV